MPPSLKIEYLKRKRNKKSQFSFKNVAAVWCSPDGYRFRWAGIWVLVDGQAGPAWHRCMGGAWHRCAVVVRLEGAWHQCIYLSEDKRKHTRLYTPLGMPI